VADLIAFNGCGSYSKNVQHR